jgi:hypothetical protein
VEIGPGDARHGDVKKQAFGLAYGVGCEELFRRRERRRGLAEFPQKVGQRFAHRHVIIDDRYE